MTGMLSSTEYPQELTIGGVAGYQIQRTFTLTNGGVAFIPSAAALYVWWSQSATVLVDRLPDLTLISNVISFDWSADDTDNLGPNTFDYLITLTVDGVEHPYIGGELILRDPRTAATSRYQDFTEGFVAPIAGGIRLDVALSGLSLTTITASLDSRYVPFKNLARQPDLIAVGTITRDSNNLPTTFPVVWPDGSTGAYTTDTTNTSPPAVNGYHITYVPVSGPTKTYTQPTITRDASGNATAVPAITVA